MADQVESQSIIDRIKAIKGVQTDKDVALLLGLTPADFFNRKKRGTLIPLIVEWALAEDRDLNELFKGLDSTCGNNVLGYSKRYTRPVYTMVSNIGPSRWLSDKPVEEIILSDDFCDGVNLVRMTGNGMEPTIHDRAIFAVDYGVSEFSSGQVFVVWIPLEGPVVRRVFIDLEKLILKADNQSYPDITIPICEIPKDNFILGRITWVLQSLCSERSKK